MYGVSLIEGWVPVGLLLLGAAGLVFLVIARPGQRLRWSLAAAAVVTAAGYVAFGVFDPLQYRFPPSFYVWFGVAVLAVGLAIQRLWSGRLLTRALGVVAATATVVAALSLVNTHYAYYPTWAALRGQISPYQVNEAGFARLQAEGADGTLPAHGVVVRVPIAGTESGFRARAAVVYLPPAWFAADRPELPVVVLVPGVPSKPGDWFRAGFADRATDRWAREHDGWAPILVVPDVNGSMFGDTECVDGPRGNAETYLVRDVRAAIIERFSAAPDGDHWALVGLSAGGTCAMTVALRHPDVFGAFANFSGDAGPNLGGKGHTVRALFGGDEGAWQAHDPATLLAERSYPTLRARFEVGGSDHGPRRAAERLAAAAEAAGVDTTLVIRSGNHSYAFWSRAFADSLDWLCDAVGVPGSTS